jgi:hypothetical protein
MRKRKTGLMNANKQTSKTNTLVYPVHCLSSRKHGTLRIGRSSDFPRKQRLPELTVALSCRFIMRITAAGTVPDFHRIPF